MFFKISYLPGVYWSSNQIVNLALEIPCKMSLRILQKIRKSILEVFFLSGNYKKLLERNGLYLFFRFILSLKCKRIYSTTQHLHRCFVSVHGLLLGKILYLHHSARFMETTYVVSISFQVMLQWLSIFQVSSRQVFFLFTERAQWSFRL